MRTLSAALQAAVVAGNATPDCRVELIDWAPHYTAVYTNGPQARGSAALALDGSIVQAYNDGAGNVYTRRVTDPTQASWGVWSARTAAAAAGAGVCVAALSDRVRLLWQDSASTQIYGADSFDSGQTWGASTSLFDAGGVCAGVAADSVSTQVLVCYAAAPNAYRLAVWSLGGGWTKADWTNGDSYAAGGIGVQRNGDGSYRVAVVLQATAAGGMAVQTSIYTGTWTALAPLAPADLGAGLTAQDPRIAAYDGLYHCSYGVVDSGSTSGIVSARAALSHSADGVHWTDPLEDGNSYTHGAVALKHPAGYVLAAADTAALALAYTGTAAQYRDCTADVSRLEVVQREGEPARLVLTLQNDVGQYVNLVTLKPNARVRLSLGYVPAGVVPTHIFYVDDWSFVRSAGESEAVVTASDAAAWLERQSRTTLVYGNQTVGYLTREILARSGLLAAQLPSTPQFAQVVPTFAIPAGSTWQATLARLSRLYGFDVAARAQPDGTDSMVIVEKSVSDAPVWSYGDEVEIATVAHSADRANHVLVFGAYSVGGPPVGEAWDFADVAAVGQERYLHVVEPLITNRSGAGIRATLELNREVRRGLSGSLSSTLHPGLELWDVVICADARLPTTTFRIATLHHIYEPQPGTNDLVLTLEGP